MLRQSRVLIGRGFVLVAALLLILLFGLFKNIQYPLLWMDEADTTIFATRIMEFGYPKVHDGKNVANHTEGPDLSVGVKESMDAWIYILWFSYYFAVIGTYLAGFFGDIYMKTAMIRIPFATIGLLGVLYLPFAFRHVFKRNRTAYFTAYLFFEILSVFLMLHLRTVRHHSINLFLTILILTIFINYRLYGRQKAVYYALLPLLLVALFMSFQPVCFMILAFIASYEAISLLRLKHGKGIVLNQLTKLLPIALAVLAILPLVSFFEVFNVMGAISKHTDYSFKVYFWNILRSIEFLLKYEYLSLLIATKIMLVGYVRKPKDLVKLIGKLKTAKLSAMLSLYLVVYLLTIGRMASLFERYLLAVQPVIVFATLVDVYLLLEITRKIKGMNKVVLWVVTAVFLASLLFRINIISNYLYEITHRYRGPMDYAVDYIKSNFKSPEELVIATNYEEYVYMYYLGSRVTVGYVGNNLEEDRRVQPDIIIPRRGRPNNIEVLAELLNKEEYELVTLPIFDYFYNNIPELGSHLYKTKLTENPEDRLRLYIRKELYEKIN